MQDIAIDGRPVGHGHPVFVIAEAGVNHNGDPALAHRLVEAAHAAGADCVKFQTFKAERVAVGDAPKADYQLKTTDPGESQIAMLRKLELPDEALPALFAACRARRIAFMSTPYNVEDADLLDRLGSPAFKLASIHVAEPLFLRQVARFGRPMIVSTGMATLAEVDTGVRAIREGGNDRIVVMQCTTNYPSRAADANLRAMATMRTALDVAVGYSDHTRTDTAVIAAVALGACVIERHFTLDPAMAGPDHSSSLDPKAFARMVASIREAEAALGSGRKEPCDAERANTAGMRRSIVARRAIAAGQVVAEADLTFKRPATGLAPAFADAVIGRVARLPIAEGAPITWEALGGRGRHD
jgi:N-acetylneuraminate synthase/N,N'-diacetyllegionaminate synthase